MDHPWADATPTGASSLTTQAAQKTRWPWVWRIGQNPSTIWAIPGNGMIWKPATKLVYVIEFDAVSRASESGLSGSAGQPRRLYSGVGMIRGWALSEEGVERIEVYIDGQYAFDVPYGDPRADTWAKRFPNIDGSGTSGFSVPFRYSALSAGEHTVSVVVTDGFGDRTERSATFDVVRFEQPFVSKADTPNMNLVSRHQAYADYITDVRVFRVGDNVLYGHLRWQHQTQSFEIVSIVKI